MLFVDPILVMEWLCICIIDHACAHAEKDIKAQPPLAPPPMPHCEQSCPDIAAGLPKAASAGTILCWGIDPSFLGESTVVLYVLC
jgi:hypothetical protein